MYKPKVESSVIAEYMATLEAVTAGVVPQEDTQIACTTRLSSKTVSLLERLASQIGESRSGFMGLCVERSVRDLARELGWLDEYDQEKKEAA